MNSVDDQQKTISKKRKLNQSYQIQISDENAVRNRVLNNNKKKKVDLNDNSKVDFHGISVDSFLNISSRSKQTPSTELESSLKQNEAFEEQADEFSFKISKNNTYLTASKQMVFQRTFEILKRDNIKQKILAKDLNLSSSTLSSIIHDKYKHLKDLHINMVREWCFVKDKALVFSILKQLKLNKIKKKDIKSLFDIEEEVFSRFLKITLPLHQRNQIDSIIVPKMKQIVLKTLESKSHFSYFLQMDMDNNNKNKEKETYKPIHSFGENSNINNIRFSNDNFSCDGNYGSSSAPLLNSYPPFSSSFDSYHLNQRNSYQQIEEQKYELHLQQIRIQEQQRELEVREYYFQQKMRNQTHYNYHRNDYQHYRQKQQQPKPTQRSKIQHAVNDKHFDQSINSYSLYQNKKNKNRNDKKGIKKNINLSEENELNDNIDNKICTGELYPSSDEEDDDKEEFQFLNPPFRTSNEFKNNNLQVPALSEKDRNNFNSNSLFYNDQQEDSFFSPCADGPLHSAFNDNLSRSGYDVAVYT